MSTIISVKVSGIKPNLKPINVHDANGAVHLCGD